MPRKKTSRVVRRTRARLSQPKGKKNAKRVTRKPATVTRKKSVVRTGTKKRGGTRGKATKQVRKTAGGKHAKSKPRKTREQPKRSELLLDLVERYNEATTDTARRALREEYLEHFPEDRAKVEAVEQMARPVSRPRFDDEDGEDDGDEYTEFRGPIGDTYDQDFSEIDWGQFDWDDVIDDIGDELLDSYSED